MDVTAPTTLPAMDPLPVFPVINSVLLSTPPLSTVKLPLPLTVVTPTTLPPVWIVATDVSFSVSVLPSVPLFVRFALLFNVVAPTTWPVTWINALSLPVNVPPTRPSTSK